MNDAALGRIERLNYLLGGVLVVSAALLLPSEQALGVLVGVVIGCLNFTMIRRIVSRWVTQTAWLSEHPDDAGGSAAGAGAKGSGASGFFLIPKMGALIAAVFLALKYLPISPAFLAIGFSVFMLSIVVETVRSVTNPPDDDGQEDKA
jgi:hypothetical protein